VGGDIRPPVKIRHVAPVYPKIALDARVADVVILEAVIAEDGAVGAVKVLRGHPLLNQAAIDAVRQWRFTPTLLNGQPVPVVMTVTVAFGLSP
jgi:protein TonB